MRRAASRSAFRVEGGRGGGGGLQRGEGERKTCLKIVCRGRRRATCLQRSGQRALERHVLVGLFLRHQAGRQRHDLRGGGGQVILYAEKIICGRKERRPGSRGFYCRAC